MEDVSEKQNDIQRSKGLAKNCLTKMATDKSCCWIYEGQGMTVDDIYFKEIGGTEYVYVNKFIEGQPTINILRQLDKIIAGIHFPINMNWADFDLRYIRPIRWIVAMFGNQVLILKYNVSWKYCYGHLWGSANRPAEGV